MFRHQMSAPVLMDLGSFDPRTANQLKALTAAQGLLLSSFADLFNHSNPPIQLLQLVKDFAKANLDHPESGLPQRNRHRPLLREHRGRPGAAGQTDFAVAGRGFAARPSADIGTAVA